MLDINFLPYLELRFVKDLPEKYDIYHDVPISEFEDNEGVNWDEYISVDYNKLSKYLHIQLILRN